MERLAWSTRRGPVGTRLLVAFARERGIKPEAALAGTGLLAAELDEPDTTVELSQELGAIRNVVHALDDAPGLGAALGARFSVAAHGDLGFAIMTCASGAEAATLCLRFAPISVVLNHVVPREERGALVVELRAEGIPAPILPFVIERDVVAFTSLVALVEPGARLRLAVALEPARVAAIAAARPEHDVIRGPTTTATLNAAVLAQQLPGADVTMCRELTRRLEDRARRWSEPAALSARVRGELVTALPQRLDASATADAVHVSPRTLRRRLREEGTTFQALADDTLRELAEELLRGEAPIATVADRLGYADAVAFTRAFKRWTGEPPGAWSHRIRDTLSASFDTL